MVDNYAKTNNVDYDYVFLTRPDLVYTIPFNISELEYQLDQRTNSRSLFSPACCAMGGLCDQVAAATYADYSHMVHSSEAWYAQTKMTGNPESHFKRRALFAKMSMFDLEATSYAFSIGRHGDARLVCELDKYKSEQSSDRQSSDRVCTRKAGILKTADQFMDPHYPGACAIVNQSVCEMRSI
jgi:hypothetical protein